MSLRAGQDVDVPAANATRAEASTIRLIMITRRGIGMWPQLESVSALSPETACEPVSFLLPATPSAPRHPTVPRNNNVMHPVWRRDGWAGKAPGVTPGGNCSKIAGHADRFPCESPRRRGPRPPVSCFFKLPRDRCEHEYACTDSHCPRFAEHVRKPPRHGSPGEGSSSRPPIVMEPRAPTQLPMLARCC